MLSLFAFVVITVVVFGWIVALCVGGYIAIDKVLRKLGNVANKNTDHGRHYWPIQRD